MPEIGLSGSMMTYISRIGKVQKLQHCPKSPFVIGQKTGEVINKRYLGDNEEGGILTLDVNVPHLSQQQLDVLPLPQWEQERSDFVYTQWVQNAIAAAGAANKITTDTGQKQ